MRTLSILAVGLCVAACSSPVTTPDTVLTEEEVQTVKPQQSLMSWQDLLSQPMLSPDQTLQTGAGATDLVDVWIPEGNGPHPTVIMIHGGCWQKSIADRTLMNYAADALRREGMAVWNIEYRGVDEEGGGYPGTFLDVARAVDALGELGPSLGLNTERVAAFGHSAGGHLALWAASRARIQEGPLASESPLPIVAVLNSGGLADLEASAPVTQAGCLADIMDTLTGSPSAARPDVFSDTSPSELLPAGVWAYSVNGAEDRIAPATLGEGYTRKAQAAGDEADVLIVPETGHVELVSPGTQAFEAETAILKDMVGLTIAD